MHDSKAGAVYARNTLSDSTLSAYQSDLLRFARFIEETVSHPANLTDFTTPHLLAFLRAEIAAGCHIHTIARRRASLSAFNLFLKRSVLDWKPISILAPASRDHPAAHRLPVSIQPAHLNALWNVMEQAPQVQACRDQALLALLLETGLPVQRSLAINLHDLRDDCRVLILAQPSGRNERLPLDWADQPLRRYLKEGRPELSRQPAEPALWISQAGRRMTRQAVWQALRGWGRRADLPFTLGPRLVSRTAAQRLATSGLSLQQIQLRLGHQSSLSTLARLRRITG